ncbi:putative quinol monooxygenase [Mycetocola spongiae]|uniref:putative quinol monooxygenase n=1 Tax=Mycetocola spongiae TaxID=2859226 RepID=UPI001CF435AD|nr:putative quinol monooxygenase [Mycetocola spongiae]UCR88749.1 antibiotic biosynthesis monooxygenase [Mycetocola spongiae]
MTTPVIVNARFFPRAGQEAALVEALIAAIAPVHAEAGCELYALNSHDSGELLMIEKWSSADLLDAHAAGPAVRDLDAAIAPFLARPVLVERFTAVPAGDVRLGAL